MTDFSELAQEVEENGVAPLAALHLVGHPDVPELVRRQLQALVVRHRLAAAARRSVIKSAVASLNRAGVDSMLLKGAAVAEVAYPDPALRPMRDVDLLVREADLERAKQALLAAGFDGLAYARPGRHEVMTLNMVVRGFSVSIDVHRRLGLPSLPSYGPLPRQTLDDLMDDSREVAIDEVSVRVPCIEDLLRGIYRHGFCLQLDEDRLRWVSVADCVTILWRHKDTLRWEWLERIDPHVSAAIGRLHHLTPLPEDVLAELGYDATRRPWAVGDRFWGWPVRDFPGNGRIAWLLATAFPSAWWLLTRHGGGYEPYALLRAWAAHIAELGYIGARMLNGAPRPER